MLLSLTQLIKAYNLKISGVIHVGAHHGQEVPIYFQEGIKDIVLIEPCAKAFTVLKNKYGAHHHIKLFNYACSSFNGTATMYTESRNKGQSNSLLQPVQHLTHYPDIVFDGQEQVQLIRLDSLVLGNKYNMLNIDVQGAEIGVLMGAKVTLQHIDYIYTEVNTDTADLYKGATKISDLDNLLFDFERVETVWTAHGWGDGLYIRKTLIM